MNCSLANSPVPSPRYIITINKIATDGTEEMLQSKYGIVTEIFVAEVFLDSNILFPLFDNDTKIVNITCQVYNSYGSDNMTSLIRTCSKFLDIDYYYYNTDTMIHIKNNIIIILTNKLISTI